MHRTLGPAVSAALLIAGVAFAPALAQAPKHGGILQERARTPGADVFCGAGPSGPPPPFQAALLS